MNNRLLQQQLQESPAITDFNNLPGVAAVLLCACAAALQSAIPAQLWTLFGGTVAAATVSLYFTRASCALTEHCIDTMMELHHTSAPEATAYQQTAQSALVDPDARCPARASARAVNRDVLTFEQSSARQFTCLLAGGLVAATLSALVAGEKYLPLTNDYGLSAEIKTATLIIGAALLALIINHLRKPMRRVVFDQAAGVFWMEQSLVFNLTLKKSAQMPIHQVVALQRIIHRPRTLPFNDALTNATLRDANQELNVVFKNRERVNLVFHNDCHTLKKDTARLSNFLQVPVWVTRQPA